MTKYRLKQSSDLTKRFEELCKKAKELNISISWIYSNSMPTWVKDEKTGREYELRDSDNNEIISEFPPTFEYKMIIDTER